MVNPFRIFFLFTAVIIGCLAFIYIFPSGEVKIYDDLAIRFFPKEKIFQIEEQDQVNIAEIIETGAVEKPAEVEVEINEEAVDSLNIKAEEVVLVKHKIQYPSHNKQALQHFFESLDRVRRERKHIRILHYGDSQLEGDRITAALREKFHNNENFGGCGVGLVPVRDIIQGRYTLKQENSGNWSKYAVYHKERQSTHKEYSLLGTFFRFTPFRPDSTVEQDFPDKILPAPSDTFKVKSSSASFSDGHTEPDEERPGDTIGTDPAAPFSFEEDHTAWFKVSKSYLARQNVHKVEKLKLLYAHNEEPVQLKLRFNDEIEIADTLEPAEGLSMLEWPVNYDFKSITLEFTGKVSPDIYGIALDGATGISVDNIAMRGTAIADFKNMNIEHISRMIRQMNVELVILQFGVNVVPNIIEDYTYYERLIYRQLMALKAAAPEVSVLVIGVSDMSMKDGLDYTSYPNIEKIRNAQKNAAFKADCAFWDLYEAMGGKNSMISWVHNDPAYAEKDYTHFNHRGAQVIGKMIYDALMEEYYVYKKIITN